MDRLPLSAEDARSPSGLRNYANGIRRALARVTNAGRYIPEIDGLRFFAILGVLLGHTRSRIADDPDRSSFIRDDPSLDVFTHPFIHGHFGVEFFFVISGFILAVPFAEHYLNGSAKPLLKSYFLRRLTRLEPPYILTLVGLFLIRWLTGFHGANALELLPHLGAGLLYMHNLVYGYANPINFVTWSLEVEIQFYLLVPLLSLLFAIGPTWLRRSAIVGVGGLFMFLQFRLSFDWYWTSTIIGCIQYFLVGFLLADLYLCDWRNTISKHWGWDVLWCAGWISLIGLWEYEWYKMQHYFVSPMVLPVALLVLYACAFRGPWANRLVTSPWLTTVGGMCYSIYLLHIPILSVAFAVTRRLPLPDVFAVYFMVQFLLLGCVVVFVAAIHFVLVEKPCMRRDWPVRAARRVRVVFGVV